MRRVYVKEEVCIGCHLCEVYSQLQHSESKDIIKAFKRVSPHPLPKLWLEEKGAVSFSVRCQQCDEAPCFYACLTGAITRDGMTGVIKVDEERCIGCWTCILVSPVRRFIAEDRPFLGICIGLQILLTGTTNSQ